MLRKNLVSGHQDASRDKNKNANLGQFIFPGCLKNLGIKTVN